MDGWLQSAGEYKGGSRITEGTGVRYNILVIQQLGLVITISGFNSHFTEGSDQSDRRCCHLGRCSSSALTIFTNTI